nr:hypothetical protein [Neobacillus sp. Marseille-Q6967]
MKYIFWAVVIFGALYSFGHGYFLLKDKNKIGAVGISIVGLAICIIPFWLRLK